MDLVGVKGVLNQTDGTGLGRSPAAAQYLEVMQI